MTAMILDQNLERQLIEQRRAWGADKHDEVWEGVYMMAPLPNDEHQELVFELTFILGAGLGRGRSARVRPGVNLAPLDAGKWEHDYRAPDVAVFLADTKAECRDTHWRGPADFLVEITSPGDRTREKLPFYSKLGVVELLIVEREGWRLELYRHDGRELTLAGISSLEKPDVLDSRRLPFTFQLVPGERRPAIRAVHVESGRTWEA
jgi:Uma2 family endonuclease